jgi:HK97 gp10 family phage protein
MLAAAKENVPVRTGKLRDALAIILDKKSPKTAPRYFLGPDRKTKAFYAHIVEWGRAPSDGDNGMPGSRFMTRAYESCRQQAVEIFGKVIGPAIEQQAAKLRAKIK